MRPATMRTAAAYAAALPSRIRFMRTERASKTQDVRTCGCQNANGYAHVHEHVPVSASAVGPQAASRHRSTSSA